METSLTESICSFREAEEQQSDHIFAPTASDPATMPLEGTVVTKADVEFWVKKIADLEAKVSALEVTCDLQAENSLIQLRLISQLRKDREPQPIQRDRSDVLRALLAASGGKMLLKEARQKMHISKSRFSELLSVMKDDLEVKPYHLRRNQKVLVLK